MTLRDLDNEQPGGAQASRIKRVGLTRRLLTAAHSGQPTHVIVKPTLILNTGFSPHDLHWRYIEPDFIVWSSRQGATCPATSIASLYATESCAATNLNVCAYNSLATSSPCATSCAASKGASKRACRRKDISSSRRPMASGPTGQN